MDFAQRHSLGAQLERLRWVSLDLLDRKHLPFGPSKRGKDVFKANRP